MGLKEYRKKRDFSQTPEPAGEVHPSDSGRIYVIHKHAARRLHYDLRLELDGVLKSWAIPKGPTLDPSERHLAVEVEDHPIEYGSFEGIIPEGEYGGGTVMLWDHGTWEPRGDATEGLRKGTLTFRLNGEKLSGVWTLARMKGEPGEEAKNWLLIKKHDDASRPLSEFDVREERQLSVATGRSMQEIAKDRDRVWHSDGAAQPEGKEEQPMARPAKPKAPKKTPDPAGLPNARTAPQPETFRPQLATLVSEPPKGDQWLHEIKYDGYRILCFFEDGTVQLRTRHGNDWTDRFAAIARAAEKLPLKNTILDGEVVVLKADGTTDFQALQNVLKGVATGTLVYYVFDVPYSAGYDLTQTPLIDRKNYLRDLFESIETGPTVRYGDYIQGGGPSVFQHACRYAVEGLICKRANGRYIQRRTRDWIKVKCLKRQEFVVGGYTEPSGSRTGFGAMLLGYYENSDLVFCGRVGTGFNEQTLSVLYNRLVQLERDRPPFMNPPKGREARGVHWISPEMVVDVEFTGWTDEDLLRHPSFKGLREDKSPQEVILEREEPLPPGEENVLGGPQAKQAKPGASTTMPKKAAYPRKTSGTRVAGVALSNPDRILYPEQGVTKLQLARFYERIADWVLPYVTQRPLTLVRCPQGHRKDCFYQKHLEEALPETLRGVEIEEKEGKGIYIILDDLPGLISLVQLGVLEIHPWGARDSDIERPDMMVFDLDPGPDVEWAAVITGARLLHERLDELGLQNFLKTTGGKGLHVVVPLTRRDGWDEVKAFSKAVVEDIVNVEPKKYVATMSKAKRKGKIFVDYVRNSRGATSVAAYSTRAKPHAPVSTPIAWDELSPDLRSDTFTIDNLPNRLDRLKKDPWRDFSTTRQSITKAMKAKYGL